jgi:hypothetical protein
MRAGFWRNCRVGFRWCRISVWLLVLAAVCAVLWLNRVGLPDFLKTRLVATLRERGVNLEFSRMRLRFERGIVAENVRLGVAEDSGPVLTLGEVQLQLDFRALLARRLQVDGLVLRQGQLLWPFSPTNTLELDGIQTDLRFQTNDTWSLDHFQANLAGAKLLFSGDIAHAPEIRDWGIFHGTGSTNFPNWQEQLEKISDTLGQIHFEGTPLLNLTVNGDARDVHSFAVRLMVGAAAAQTPWFRARDLELTANLTAPANAPTHFDPAWGFWTNAQPFQLEWSARGAQWQSEKLNADAIAAGGFWRAPELAVTNLSVELGGGRLDANARLNVATRELVFTNASCFDLHAVYAWLTKKTVERLSDFYWTRLPALNIGGALVLPAWTNEPADWLGAVRPTMRLSGELGFTNATVMGAQIDSAHTHFSYLDLTWQLPDLAVAQADSHLQIAGFEDDATKKYRWQIRGALDPEAARPFLSPGNGAHGLDLVQLTEPLALDLNVSGKLYDLDSLAVDGNLAATNFMVRHEQVGDVATAVNYTNEVLTFLQPLLHTGAQTAAGGSVTLDFNRRLIFFTNVLSITDPWSVARAIGPQTARLVAPYHFFQPPTVRVNGRIPLGGLYGGSEMTNVDMRFDIVKGGKFAWLKLNTTNITGSVLWRGQTLTLTNVVAAFYGGTGVGSAFFDFHGAHEGGDYQYAVDVTNVNLHALAREFFAPTNQLEGAFAGELVVTNASTENWRTLAGHGRVSLRDGLLWDIPAVRILSPVLDAFSPGLGNSRATEASGNFVISNGLISTGSLEIRSTMTRLEYVGTIDLDQNVNARVTAQLLRDLPGGQLISTVLWPVSKLFEYRVTGTLADPKSEPIYVLPKLLLIPLHPIRTLEDFIPDNVNQNNPLGN